MSGVANAAARQGVKLDFGATHATRWAVKSLIELAATPTAGNTVDLYLSPSDSATAGTDNAAGCTGTDAAYTGINSNLTASLKLLQYIGSIIVTADPTTTTQQSDAITFRPRARYNSLVVVNNSGAAWVGNNTNTAFTFRPLEETQEAS